MWCLWVGPLHGPGDRSGSSRFREGPKEQKKRKNKNKRGWTCEKRARPASPPLLSTLGQVEKRKLAEEGYLLVDGLYYGVQSTEYRDHPYSFGLTVYMYVYGVQSTPTLYRTEEEVKNQVHVQMQMFADCWDEMHRVVHDRSHLDNNLPILTYIVGVRSIVIILLLF